MRLRNIQENNLEEIARSVIDSLSKKKGATVIFLEGDLGSGKTTFTKYLAKVLGYQKSVRSPTFVIMNEYETEHGKYERVFHIDAYRLEKGEDSVLNLDEIRKNNKHLIIVEWPERVSMKDSDLHIRIKSVDENTREFHLTYAK